jgi:hypothetical protein
MMGERRVRQDASFYEFSLERHVPETHLLQSIDRFVELDGLRRELAPFVKDLRLGNPKAGDPGREPRLVSKFESCCFATLDAFVVRARYFFEYFAETGTDKRQRQREPRVRARAAVPGKPRPN